MIEFGEELLATDLDDAWRLDELTEAQRARIVEKSVDMRLRLRSLTGEMAEAWRRFEAELGEEELNLLWYTSGGFPRLVGLLDDLVVALLRRRNDSSLIEAVSQLTEVDSPDEPALILNDALDAGNVLKAYNTAIGIVSSLAKATDWVEAPRWSLVEDELAKVERYCADRPGGR